MVNRITRRVPISRYSIPYVTGGTVKTVELESLSGLNSSDLFEIARAYIDDFCASNDGDVYISPDYRETPIRVFTYEMPLTHFIEHAIRRGEKNENKED